MKNLSILSILTVISFGCDSKKELAPKPNIILVMTDDQGWGQVLKIKVPL